MKMRWHLEQIGPGWIRRLVGTVNVDEAAIIMQGLRKDKTDCVLYARRRFCYATLRYNKALFKEPDSA